MAKKITRRRALAAGAATTGALFNSVVARGAHAWAPGPDKNLIRDLTPGTTMIRLGTDSADLKNLGIDLEKKPVESIKQIREAGRTGMFVGPEPWYSMKDSELREFNAALKQHDVVIFEVHGYVNMIHPDEETRQKYLQRQTIAIEAADKIGCPMVGTITGSCDPQYGYTVHPNNWTEETWKRTVDSIRQVLRDTAGMKAALGMEAQITTNLDSPKAHKRLMDDVGDPRCKVNLDPTNMCCLANYYHTTELINECFDLLGEDILGCYAKDTYIWPDTQTVHVQEVCPGRGVMDYETFLVRMSRMKWSRTLRPEHIPDDQYPEAYAYIKKVAAKVGVKIHG